MIISTAWRWTRRYMSEGDASGGGGESAPASAPIESPSGGYDSIGAAVAELDRRDAERSRQAREQKQAQQAQEQPQEQDQADDGQPETEETAPQEPRDDSDEVATDDQDDVTPETPTEPLKLAGQTYEIPKGTPPAVAKAIQEVAGRLEADYTRKTQGVAAERQQVQAEYQHTQQLRQRQEADLQSLQVYYQHAIGEPPDPSLLQHGDVQGYLLQKQAYEQRVQAFQGLQQRGEALRQQQQQEQMQRAQAFKSQAAQALLQEMPELADAKGYAEFRSAAVKTAARYGVSEQEIASVMDPRMLVMLRDLARLQQREASAGNIRQKLDNTPPRVQKPGAATQDQGKGQRARDALGQFKQSARTLADVKKYIQRTS